METVSVDVAVRDDTDDDLLRTAEHGTEQLFASFRRALLGVVQKAERPHLVVAQAPVVEQDSRDDEWPGETASSGLVRAGDEPCTELAVESQKLLAGAERHGREDTRLLGGLFRVGLCRLGLCLGLGRRLGCARAVLTKLADARLLAHLAAKVIELRAGHVAERRHLCQLDLWGMQREH